MLAMVVTNTKCSLAQSSSSTKHFNAEQVKRRSLREESLAGIKGAVAEGVPNNRGQSKAAISMDGQQTKSAGIMKSTQKLLRSTHHSTQAPLSTCLNSSNIDKLSINKPLGHRVVVLRRLVHPPQAMVPKPNTILTPLIMEPMQRPSTCLNSQNTDKNSTNEPLADLTRTPCLKTKTCSPMS